MTFREVMKLSELWTGELRTIEIDGARVLLLRTDDGVFAYEDRCPHLGVPLSKGSLDGCTLTCNAHQYQYDARTGQGINPKNLRLAAYPVRCEREAIWVDVAPTGSVGPILAANDLGRAIAQAIVEQNPGAEIIDRGAYLRVLAKGRCELRRDALERATGAPFQLPTDLEGVMPAFEGYLRIDGGTASWSDRP